jgi:hypothetical protein
MSLPSQSWVIVATSTADWTCKRPHGVLPDPAHPCVDLFATETGALLACTGIAANDSVLVINYAQAAFGADIEEHPVYDRARQQSGIRGSSGSSSPPPARPPGPC